MSEEVRKMFGAIAARYDAMNDILSFGIHRLWRRRAMKLLKKFNPNRILDCATGTGDVAFALERNFPSATIIGTDFCEEMMVPAREKAAKRESKIEFMFADATDLQFSDKEFDAATISFGIRNVDDTSKCLREMARVVRPGGAVVVIEFGAPKGLIAPFYKFYSRVVMPLLGSLFAGDKSAYTYLPQTAEKYPCREQFVEIMDKTGAFTTARYVSLTFGIAYIYVGTVK